MRAEDFRQLVLVRPFKPFRVYMTDGQTFDVRHPDLVIVSRSWVAIGVPDDPASGVADRIDQCSLLHVVRVEDLPMTVPPGNGEQH